MCAYVSHSRLHSDMCTKQHENGMCVCEVSPGTAITYSNVKESQHHREGGREGGGVVQGMYALDFPEDP